MTRLVAIVRLLHDRDPFPPMVMVWLEVASVGYLAWRLAV